jgi:hypothetical protein
MIYSGFIDCGGNEADYEFESDEILDGMGQLNWLLNTGVLQIMDSEPRSDDDDYEDDDL